MRREVDTNPWMSAILFTNNKEEDYTKDSRFITFGCVRIRKMIGDNEEG